MEKFIKLTGGDFVGYIKTTAYYNVDYITQFSKSAGIDRLSGTFVYNFHYNAAEGSTRSVELTEQGYNKLVKGIKE